MSSEKLFTEINKIENVSRETFSQLQDFCDLLLKWNKSINLVSKSHASREDIWSRHIVDSLQLAKYIPDTANVITDLGSGGGFPGVVLAILGKWQMHLVESDKRKCAFLVEATRHLSNKVTICNQRIENLEIWPTDVITARALAPVDKLLQFSDNFCEKNKICLFLKGQNVVEEIEEAAKYWDIQYQIYPSHSDPTGHILEITKHTSRRAL